MTAATHLSTSCGAPAAEHRPFAELSPQAKQRLLAAVVRDLRRYLSELSPIERAEVALCLPLGGRGVDSLTSYQRARLVAVGLPLLRRVGGWA